MVEGKRGAKGGEGCKFLLGAVVLRRELVHETRKSQRTIPPRVQFKKEVVLEKERGKTEKKGRGETRSKRFHKSPRTSRSRDGRNKINRNVLSQGGGIILDNRRKKLMGKGKGEFG